jgi:hypothetical protein
MLLFDFLKLFDSTIVPSESKIHLATNDGKENPLEVYKAGNFDEWQRKQSKKNFERKYVISLIALPEKNSWLFAGVHVHDAKPKYHDKNQHYYYLIEDSNFSEVNGRLVLSFEREGRQPYLNAENYCHKISILEIKPKRMSISEFPGYKNINIKKFELDLIVNQSLESWRTALLNVAGVYLISDTESGKLYVGSATGKEGIWQRWSDYAKNGHGGNVQLKQLLNVNGADRSTHFLYSVLEIADTHTSKEDILDREKHWKDVLLSRSPNGLNDN